MLNNSKGFFWELSRHKILVLLLSILICGCSEKQLELGIQKTNSVPLIDGRVDTIWNKARWQNIEKSPNSTFKKEDLSGAFKVLHNNSGLYFLFNIIDDIRYRRPLPASLLEAKYDFFDSDKNDCVMLKFNIKNNPEPDWKENNLMFIYDYDSVVAVGMKKKYKIINDIEFGQKTTSIGYLMEMYIPFNVLNVEPKNSFIETQVVIFDNDNNIILPGTISRSTGNLFWGQKKKFGRFIIK